MKVKLLKEFKYSSSLMENSRIYTPGTVVDFYEGWEGSFEKKFGKRKVGLEKIKELIQTLQGQNGETVSEESIGKLVDLDSFYTFWAVEGLIGFWEMGWLDLVVVVAKGCRGSSVKPWIGAGANPSKDFFPSPEMGRCR